MKTKDYLHSDLLNNRQNNAVFEQTYALIERLANKVTEIEKAAFNVTDKDSIETLQKINAIWLSDEIVDLVNYAIDKFDKRRTS
jgi:dihydroneopterin aldolase